jgi:hypothetical protein
VSEPTDAPVFVVGGPRSGTTLLSAMLAAHPSFDCGPETHCLSRWARLGPRERARILDPTDWPERATRYVASLSLGKKPVHLMYGISVDEVRADLAGRQPSLAALLESLTAQRARVNRTSRWVEKTPRHLEVPELIIEAWPHARIVRIVRDPRDAAVSLTRVPFGTESLLTNLSVLARMNEVAASFYRTSASTFTLRYEDLIDDPEGELTRLCEFIGEPFERAMIEGREASGSVAAEHEWWKGDVTGPLDPTRSGGWTKHMPPRVQHYAALNLGQMIEEHGYGQAATPALRLSVVPAGDAISARYDDVLLRLADDGVAIRRPVPLCARELNASEPVVFFGVVGQLDLDRDRTARARVIEIARLGLLLLVRRLQGRPVFWVRRLSLIRRHKSDGGERFMARLLQVLTRPAEAEDLPGIAAAAGRR